MPGTDLGHGDAGMNCMWSLTGKPGGRPTKEADLYYEGARELLNSFK